MCSADRGFLVAMGVRKVADRDRIVQLLQKHYVPNAALPEWPAHLEHMTRFVRWWSEHKNEAALFKEHAIFFGDGPLRILPGDVYLDTPNLETGLAALFAAPIIGISRRLPIRATYREGKSKEFNEFAAACGVMCSLEIMRTTSQANPNRAELRGAGGSRT